jgi:hypothetical protein
MTVREVKGKPTWIVAVVLMAVFSVHGATHTFVALVDEVLRNGPGSQLPAHLSVMLGVSAVEQATAVKQAVLRDGDTVRTFNVCTDNHKNLVIVTHNEKTQATKAYLLTDAAVLRKAIDYQAGEPARERSLADARSDFAGEIKFWTDFPRQPQPSPQRK